jgi:hypothetical protein
MLIAALRRPIPLPQYGPVYSVAESSTPPDTLPAAASSRTDGYLLRFADIVAEGLSRPGTRLFGITAIAVQGAAMAPLACLLSAALWPAAAGLWLLRHPHHAVSYVIGAGAFAVALTGLLCAVFFMGGLKSMRPVAPLEAAFRIGILAERPARRRRIRGLQATLCILGALGCGIATCIATWEMLRLLPGGTSPRPFAALLIGIAIPWVWLGWSRRDSRRSFRPLVVCAMLQFLLVCYLASAGYLGSVTFWPY